MSLEQDLRDAELAFLNAPFQPDGWRVATRKLVGITGSTAAQVIGLGGPDPFTVISDDLPDPRGHLTNPALLGACNWRIGAIDGHTSLQHEPHFEAYRALHPTSDYDDAVSDLDTRFGCQAPLITDSAHLFGLAMFRSNRQGRCDADVLERFSNLAHHAQRALRVQLALGQQAAELMLEGVAGRTEATLLLDRFAGLAAMTAAAEKLFDHPQGLRLDGLLVRLADRTENASFAAAVGRLFASDGLTGPVLHEGRAGRCPQRPAGRWRLLIARLPAVAQGFGFEPHLAVTLTPIEG